MKASGTSIVIVAVVWGVALGLGSYTFAYARGWAYMTDDPQACKNCHVMNEQYDGWIKSSHRSVAVCNDCHVPHAMLAKYATKARNGFWHSFYFTVGGFPDPIQMTPRNRAITEASCAKCHTPITSSITHGPGAVSCVRCHASVGHLR
jgi:cytochrome c nitrite reductase small subunit